MLNRSWLSCHAFNMSTAAVPVNFSKSAGFLNTSERRPALRCWRSRLHRLDNTSTFSTAVLKTVKSKISHLSCLRMPPKSQKTPHSSFRDLTVCHRHFLLFFCHFYANHYQKNWNHSFFDIWRVLFPKVTHSTCKEMLVFISGIFLKRLYHNVLNALYQWFDRSCW